MAWSNYLIVLVVLGGLFFLSAIYALYWAAKNGQFRNFEKGAKVIFNEEEPEGERTDFFPGESKKHRKVDKAAKRDSN